MQIKFNIPQAEQVDSRLRPSCFATSSLDSGLHPLLSLSRLAFRSRLVASLGNGVHEEIMWSKDNINTLSLDREKKESNGTVGGQKLTRAEQTLKFGQLWVPETQEVQ